MEFGEIVEYQNMEQRIMSSIIRPDGLWLRLSISGLTPAAAVKRLQPAPQNEFSVGDMALIYDIPRAEKVQYTGGWSNKKQTYLAPRGPFEVDKVQGQCVRIKGGEWFLCYHLTKVNTYDMI